MAVGVSGHKTNTCGGSMLTYSGYNQPAIASYGTENVRNLLAAQAKYDPTKVFTRLVPGGQKLPASA